MGNISLGELAALAVICSVGGVFVAVARKSKRPPPDPRTLRRRDAAVEKHRR